jgi:integrase
MMSETTKRKRNPTPGITKATDAAGNTIWKAVADVAPIGAPRDQKRQTFATKAAAVAWREEIRSRRRRGEVVQPSQRSLASWFAEWLSVRALRVRPSSTQAYQDAFNRIDPLIGTTPLARLTPSQVERAYAELAARYRPATIRAVHRLLRMLTADAIRDGLLARDPTASVTLPDAEDAARPARSWTMEEAQRFTASLGDDPVDLLWRFLLESWLRSGEARALRWSDLDLDARLIHVRRTVTLAEDGTRTTGPPKSRTSQRTVSMSADLVARLRTYRESQPRAMTRDPLVFGRDGGQVWHPARLGVLLREACEAAKVPVLSLHGLRHTGGSLAHARGVPMAVISERLGHSNLTTTMGIYLHSDRDQLDSVAETLADLLTPLEPADSDAHEAEMKHR